MEYIITFFTSSGAIKFQRYAKKLQIEIILMPVPRKFSSSCGTAAKIKYDGNLKNIIIEDIDSIFLSNSLESKLMYKHP